MHKALKIRRKLITSITDYQRSISRQSPAKKNLKILLLFYPRRLAEQDIFTGDWDLKITEPLEPQDIEVL